MKLIGLLLTFCVVRLSHADPYNYKTLELPRAIEASIQTYFGKVNRDVNLVGEPRSNIRVRLVIISNPDIAAFVNPNNPNEILWSANFFVRSPSVDLDRFVAAHERSHFGEVNRSITDERAREYHGDLAALSERLLKKDQREPGTGDPAPAVVNVDELSRAFADTAIFSDKYIDHQALSAWLTANFMRENGKRYFPPRATPRTEIAGAIEFVRELIKDEVFSKSSEASPLQTEIETLRARIGSDLPGALHLLDLRRQHKIVLKAAPEEHHKLQTEFRDTIILLAQKTEDQSALGDAAALGRTFDQFARLRPTLLTDFFLNDLAPELVLDLRRGSEANDDLASFKWLQTPRSNYALAPITVASRLYNHLLGQGRQIDLEQRPFLTLVLAYLNRKLTRLGLTPQSSRVIAQFNKEFGARLTQAESNSDVARKLVASLREMRGDASSVRQVAEAFFSIDFDQDFPGFRDTLRRELPLNGFESIHLALAPSPEKISDFLNELLVAGRGRDFLAFFNEVSPLSPNLDNDQKAKLLKLLLKQSSTREDAYLPGLSLALHESLKEINALKPALKRRVERDPVAFTQSWFARFDETQTYVIWMAVPWKEVFRNLDLSEVISVLKAYRNRAQKKEADAFLAVPFHVALGERINALFATKALFTDADLQSAIRLLSLLGTTSPYAEQLLARTLEGLNADASPEGSWRLHEFLTEVSLLHFTNTRQYIRLYVDSFVQSTARRGAFRDLPWEILREEILRVRSAKLDPLTGQAILDRLAERYEADWDLKSEFQIVKLSESATSQRWSGSSDAVRRTVEEFHLWAEILNRLSAPDTVNVLRMLRAEENLRPELRHEIQTRLANSNVAMDAQEVQSYLKRRFRELPPLYRAGVVQMILDNKAKLLDDTQFRRSLFEDILQTFKTASARATFTEIWDAGLHSLPPVIRSFLLSIIVSESGKVGSPESALVMALSHSGPLEQKWGQNLGLADIPKAYRDKLQTTWDGAQQLTWWEAWELMLLQAGDVRALGFKLSAILNSGSTVAYLQITHRETKQKYVIPVYRDGIRRAAEVGVDQLRMFTRLLTEKDPKRWGFLRLLVEDAYRTVRRELDRERKLIMTDKMATAYREAARGLGWKVGDNGVIDTGHVKFALVANHRLTLPNGRPMYVQDFAEGESFRLMAERDPKRYKRITQTILRLETAVRRDPKAPVDKDRMPGQFLDDASSDLVYILDAGQALNVDPELKTQAEAFTRAGVIADTTRMSQILRLATHAEFAVSEDIRDHLARTESGLRPLVFLGEVAPSFLDRDEGDPSKESFFDLLHAVRAELRLLQWERSEGLTDLARGVRRDILKTTPPWQLAQLSVGNFWKAWMDESESDLRRIFFSGAMNTQKLVRRMDESYLKSCGKALSAHATSTP